jgi:hypothetical protein
MQRLDRTALEAKLAVIVVLDHDGVSLLRPREQGEPPLGGHRHPERKLVRGGDVDQTDVIG